MKLFLAALITVAVLGSASLAYAGYSTSDQWYAVWVPQHESLGTDNDAYVWNPNHHTITHIDPDRELVITERGHWDIVQSINTASEIYVNGTLVNMTDGRWTLPVIWLEEQVNKIWKLVNLHDKQITDMYDTIDALEQKLGKQAKRIQALEKQLEPPAAGNQPPIP